MFASRLTLVLHLFLAVVLSGQLTFHAGKTHGNQYLASSEATVSAFSETEERETPEDGLSAPARPIALEQPADPKPSVRISLFAAGILELRSTGPPAS